MDDIKQKNLQQTQLSNINKRLYRQSLNKKVGTHVHKSMTFKVSKKTL